MVRKRTIYDMFYDRHNPPVFEPNILPEDIQLLAYQKWEWAGRPTNCGDRFWKEAYRELFMKAVCEVYSTKSRGDRI